MKRREEKPPAAGRRGRRRFSLREGTSVRAGRRLQTSHRTRVRAEPVIMNPELVMWCHGVGPACFQPLDPNRKWSVVFQTSRREKTRREWRQTVSLLGGFSARRFWRFDRRPPTTRKLITAGAGSGRLRSRWKNQNTWQHVTLFLCMFASLNVDLIKLLSGKKFWSKWLQ